MNENLLPRINKEAEACDATVCSLRADKRVLEQEILERIAAFEESHAGVRIGNMEFRRKADPFTKQPADMESVRVALVI